jgi:hypothetical protein
MKDQGEKLVESREIEKVSVEEGAEERHCKEKRRRNREESVEREEEEKYK